MPIDFLLSQLQTLIPAQMSFQEDCARILRGLRIAGRLGLTISKDIAVAIRKLSSTVGGLDKSRIMMELNYMLSYGAAESTIYLLQRYQLLEVFLPFHAAYLQAGKRSAWSSMMLMKLLVSLDKLVSCDRPCNCTLWVGLFAFHQALVIKPQDALVISVFASVLYHGKWQEGVKFARESATMQVNFVPEISGSSELKSDEKLAEEVAQFASLVQDSAGAFIDGDSPFKPTFNNPGSTCSGLVFVPKKTAQTVAELFNVLVIDIESYDYGRENFTIDYALLGLGHLHETRFVLGKVILDTLGMGTVEGGMKVFQEREFIDTKCSMPLSSLAKNMVAQKNKEHVIFPSDPGSAQEMDRKQKFLNGGMLPRDKIQEIDEKQLKRVENFQLPEEELNTMQGSELDKNQGCQPQQLMSDNRNVVIRGGNYEERARQHKNTVEKCRQQILHDKKTKHPLSISDSSKDWEMKRKEKKYCHLSLQEVVKEKTEHYKQILVEERSGSPSLSALFRR
uniref:Uncharacterized protein MANES_01G154100 n=1 Tax=Rhizophora mucronata TaxID=61149 RepID=A0A2P2JDC7_RHIMU